MKRKVQQQNTIQKSKKKQLLISFLIYGAITTCAFLMITIGFFVVQGRQIASKQEVQVPTEESMMNDVLSSEFPVGVDPKEKEIVELPEVEEYFNEYIRKDGAEVSQKTSWVNRALGKLALMGWYQNLASLSSRILVIESGERKEQVAENFAKILKWSKPQKAEFLSRIQTDAPELQDGKFYPGRYTVEKNATPEVVANLILNRFHDEVLSRYTNDIEEKVPLNDTLTIASLLEREAYDFEDMRHISGVIWNRLFADMRLQIDATLQYAKGSDPSQPWWPKVVPADKYLSSVYNTYKNEGLPPTPIANPSLAAILAALNPTETDCMYYFHDRKAGFHCSTTYEEHVKLLKQYYGNGK